MQVEEFTDCCGLAIISELDVGRTNKYEWATTHENPEIFEKELCHHLHENRDYKNFVAVTNPDQKMFEPVLLKYDFKPIVDGFYNRNTGNRLVLWFKTNRNLLPPKHRRVKT